MEFLLRKGPPCQPNMDDQKIPAWVWFIISMYVVVEICFLEWDIGSRYCVEELIILFKKI
jgi:hypothetical protein